MTNETQFFRKIYLSDFIRNGTKGLRKGYVWEVSWRLNKTVTYWPPSSSGYSSTSFSFYWAAQPGAWGPSSQSGAGFHAGILSPKLWLQLTKLPFAPGCIIVWRSSASCGCHFCTKLNPSTVKVIPDIFDRMHLLFTQVHFLFDSLYNSEFYLILIICLHTVTKIIR